MPALRDLPRDSGFVEIADRVWVARHSWLDVNITAVAGERGLAVVDTHASDRAARAAIEELRRAVAADVVAVVNTHEHFDHAFGNAAFAARWPQAAVISHEVAAEALAGFSFTDEELADEPHAEELLATAILPASSTFSSARVIDLGDRAVELIHPGRGHTGGDIVAVVADAGVVLAGDLTEESADRDGVPGFGADCYPMSWPATLDLVLHLIGPDTVVVPGHGNPVDRGFVEEQRAAIGVVAETIRDLAHRGVPVDQALSAADGWPYPAEQLALAVRRGYEELPRSQRRLPLL